MSVGGCAAGSFASLRMTGDRGMVGKIKRFGFRQINLPTTCADNGAAFLRSPMAAFDPVLFRQLPVIQKIIADETWLEAERRGSPVTPDDPAVKERVCEVILRIGAGLRESLALELADAPRKISPDDHTPHAA